MCSYKLWNIFIEVIFKIMRLLKFLVFFYDLKLLMVGSLIYSYWYDLPSSVLASLLKTTMYSPSMIFDFTLVSSKGAVKTSKHYQAWTVLSASILSL